MSKGHKTSWVWQHFEEKVINGVDKLVCQISMSESQRCLTLLKPAATGSTKSLAKHLERKHGMTRDGNRSRTEEIRNPKELTRENLIESLANLIINHHLHVTIVDSNAFKNLFNLVNPAIMTIWPDSVEMQEYLERKTGLTSANSPPALQD
ncbi:hypothetical protein CROQUDRAFT_44270 [Cronartium quercuum f. sp. fusiforme G11]|uniref:BED-type domain-containing protein n=1 Tax=Cronartium quercuum f. sp. fusiforme G11 TaxID=708437 RepID=A0A9P6TCA9_9BASI|nr:hypothetical protein CROQUDRAFT_44270 [Cronartium quercuum f. sp. fusiforme G11]